ncbi:MAG: hypothetical protein LBU15_03145 [Rickettsiales bacterium]|jgi:uncharacterized integral membrane protein|nr:hypothetical protein [Rickettsiales bacterium]
MMRGLYSLLKLILFFLFFMLCVAFALNNADFVKLNLSPLNYVVEVRLFLLLLMACSGGSLVTIFFGHLCRFFSLFDLGRFYSSRRIRTLENELRKLRASCGKSKTPGKNETNS